MPLATLDRTPPPFFRQGPSAFSRLLLFAALALFLMVADARFHLVQPIRAVIATVLYPAQWLALQPVQWTRAAGTWFTDLQSALASVDAAERRLAEQSLRASQTDQLLLENARLRALLGLRERLPVSGQAAQVLYDATDPYTRRVVIDKGQLQGIEAGAPVVDETGVLGQVTQVYPLVSEVTLLIDRAQVIPVVNTRSGVRGVVWGDPGSEGGMLEQRYVPANADVHVGDLLATSGIDGVYPPGLPVARVSAVERDSDSGFALVRGEPLAQLKGVTHVMVLTPVGPPQAGVAGPVPAAPASAATAAGPSGRRAP